MKSMKRLFYGLVAVAIMLTTAAWLALPHLNRYQVEGEVTLLGLKSMVTVIRDPAPRPV